MIIDSIHNQKGSIRHGIILILVMLFVVLIFQFIDRKEDETRDFGFTKDPDRFDETKEQPFFNDDDFSGQSSSQQAYQPLLEPVDEEDVEKEDPDMAGKSSQNSFYTPPTPEKRRELESSNTTPKLRP